MKKVVLAILLGLALAFIFYGFAWAGPSLVCSRTANTQTYSVDLDGIITSGIILKDGWVKDKKLYLADPGGTTILVHVLMDTVPIVEGAHTVKVKGCNAFTCGEDSAPFTFIKAIPGVPMSVTIISQ